MPAQRTRVAPRVQVPTDKAGGIAERAAEIEREELERIRTRRDVVFARFLLIEWALAVAIAGGWAALTWRGHLDATLVLEALGAGGLINGLVAIARAPPRWAQRRWGDRWGEVSRPVMVCAQMLFAALFVHVLGGRAEVFAVAFMALGLVAAFRQQTLLHLALGFGLAVGLVHVAIWPEDLYGRPAPGADEVFAFVALLCTFWLSLVRMVKHSLAETAESAMRQATLEHVKRTVESRVDERTRELVESRELYRQLIETTRTIPFELSVAERRFSFIGPQVGELLGVSPETATAPGFFDAHVHREDLAQAFERLTGLHLGARVEVELRVRRTDGVWVWVRFIASIHKEVFAFDPGQPPRATVEPQSGPLASLELLRSTRRLLSRTRARTVIRGVMFDVTDTRRLEMELRQAQKLESVGRLASGVAHEINTPVQFVSDSVYFLRDALADLTSGLVAYRALAERAEAVRQTVSRVLSNGEGGADADAVKAALAAMDELSAAAAQAVESDRDKDLDYLVDNAPRALERALDGVARVATIVRSMKQFAHPDQKDMCAVDINQGIRSTLVIAENELKYVADVETDLGDLPPVMCHGGDINQVVLNLVVNAAHAIADRTDRGDERGRIRLTTRRQGDTVLISVSDTGRGIPLAIRERIFEPFFTTKEVGRGTGQGLPMSRSIVVEKHHGELWFETEEGVGTVFYVRLPIDGHAVAREAA